MSMLFRRMDNYLQYDSPNAKLTKRKRAEAVFDAIVGWAEFGAENLDLDERYSKPLLEKFKAAVTHDFSKKLLVGASPDHTQSALWKLFEEHEGDETHIGIIRGRHTPLYNFVATGVLLGFAALMVIFFIDQHAQQRWLVPSGLMRGVSGVAVQAVTFARYQVARVDPRLNFVILALQWLADLKPEDYFEASGEHLAAIPQDEQGRMQLYYPYALVAFAGAIPAFGIFLAMWAVWRLRQREDGMIGCKVCDEPAEDECDRCRTPAYCSVACQAKDWVRGGHYKVCRQMCEDE
jgi:hypothetical protein